VYAPHPELRRPGARLEKSVRTPGQARHTQIRAFGIAEQAPAMAEVVPVGNATHPVDVLPPSLVWASFAAALLATLIALYNVARHVANYTQPALQKPTIRVIFIVPFFAVFSWLALALPAQAVLFESVRDVYEAFVIYEFLKLVLAYTGGEAACIEVLMVNPGSIAHLWPLNYCLPRMAIDASFFRWTRRLALQFVLVKPIMALCSIVYFELGDSSSASFQAFSTAQLWIYNVSYTLALYGLLMFYFASHHHPGLEHRRPVFKFFSVKAIVFATYYQALLVQLVGAGGGWSSHFLQLANNFVFCFEMVVFAIVHIVAFGWSEFKPSRVAADNDNGEPAAAAKGGALRTGLRNLGKVAHLGDVVDDAAIAMSTAHDGHVALPTSASRPVFTEDDSFAGNPFAAENARATSPRATAVAPVVDSNPFLHV